MIKKCRLHKIILIIAIALLAIGSFGCGDKEVGQSSAGEEEETINFVLV
ncbi:MAG TPA: hypothetical protein GX717_00095 [Clostridiaceae bacterium]|nr:hypothetical protein [Clostridiaceae bacterium]